jgi:DNA-binding NarL/FixJ family response regulator
MIRVLLVDDQALIRTGFAAIINSADDMTVVGQAANGHEAIEQAKLTLADVVLMDIRMPQLDGLAATRTITSDESLASVRIIILTTFELDEYVVDAMRSGASGFLDKGVDANDLLNAIRTVAAGDALLTPRATRALLAQFTADPESNVVDDSIVASLTTREREVLALVGHGLSNDEIAEQLFVSPLTAKTHVNRAMTKLGARDRAQLVVVAFRSGLTRVNDLRPLP